jgi:UMF1 family MFS transporter
MYDWANSAFYTTVITAVFPIYFQSGVAQDMLPAQAAERFTIATVIALAIAALLGPILGAMIDVRAWKKRVLGAGMVVGVCATAGLVLVVRGDVWLGLGLFMLGNVAVSSAQVAYDSLLPHVARDGEVHRLSTAGYALGYLGGGLLLALNVLMLLKPALFGFADAGQASRACFATVAVWWLVFSLPLLRRVPEPPVTARPARSVVRDAFASLRGTLRELRRFRHATLLLVAFLIYNDGIGTIIRMATTYGTEIGIPVGDQITAILIIQFIGIPASFGFGHLAGRIGAKPAVLGALGVYALISVLGYFMTSSLHFFLLAGLVGLVQGGTQALSRSLFARMIPVQKSGEFFGLFAVFEKFAGIAGPLVFYLAIRSTGSSRGGILSVIVFFAVGALLLSRVDVAAGEREARAAEAGQQ